MCVCVCVCVRHVACLLLFSTKYFLISFSSQGLLSNTSVDFHTFVVLISLSLDGEHPV